MGDTGQPRVAKVQFPADKCSLVYKHTEFVGHLIFPGGHSSILSDVEKIATYETSRTKLERQMFIAS